MNKVIGWFSGGVTSAVAIYKAIELYGSSNVKVIFIDTQNEDADTYRFLLDCEKWYGIQIESISGLGDKFKSIKDVWYKYKSLNVANGAICSSTLKLNVRKKWETANKGKYSAQVFGFDISEPKRAESMALNYSYAKPIFPLLMFGLSKENCIEILKKESIDIPRAYKLGFRNNNCLQSGCVQGGIGYWQKIKREFPKKFEEMANVEHELTDLKGKPVTMLKDQARNVQLFLKPHKDYPNLPDISMKKGREPKPLVECNGFCGINDLSKKNETENEINYEQQLKLL